MEPRLIALKLLLDELGIEVTDQQPAGLQEAVYLAQAAGAHLGYQFHWQNRYPLPPDVARDMEKRQQEILGGTALHRCFVLIDLDEPLELAVAFVNEEWRAVLRNRDEGAVIETGYGPDRASALKALADRLEANRNA